MNLRYLALSISPHNSEKLVWLHSNNATVVFINRSSFYCGSMSTPISSFYNNLIFFAVLVCLNPCLSAWWFLVYVQYVFKFNIVCILLSVNSHPTCSMMVLCRMVLLLVCLVFTRLLIDHVQKVLKICYPMNSDISPLNV